MRTETSGVTSSRGTDRDRTPALNLVGVTKVYGKDGTEVRALNGVSVAIPRGTFTAVMGPSGSGKSTFMHCAAGLDRPTSGSTEVGGTELTRLGETALTKLRRKRIGFVFQSFNLVPSLTVRQNVELPLRLAGERIEEAWLTEVLGRVGLDGRAGHRPGELSGGQQQRVAIARALVTRPDVIFGDEPTGALDTVTAREILALLRECVDEGGQTVVMVTHDPGAASYADRVLFLADGSLAGHLDRPTAEAVAERMTRLGAWS
ncbi:ABC transporter ATP-binding protein [Streptomyces lavendulae]|uniref:ABC transporter ATP-binding protein YxdL n=1 Tax=Streptomyces lavendulae subsp. lavendulae TaxID=58340 RepID=A0A2K8PB23_STRLA|nr:ABC transporter ATP-binding protein [Streptomyces lavendulae]ATZ23939.1 ABC transporter ATP-binding protein YxdL [Streptomyces lavendulae subsp. lavendulae]QUQ53770.1 ABC transporter ATP-binding protein YxdL [Streptomyces lavendulae subsp. lavendulae]